MFRLMFSHRWWWTTLIVFVGIGVAIRLGIWQLDRNAERRSSISDIQVVQAMPMLDLVNAPLPSDLTDMEYRQVKVSGEYDFEHQVALRNQAWTHSWGAEPGYALLTPLILSNG